MEVYWDLNWILLLPTIHNLMGRPKLPTEVLEIWYDALWVEILSNGIRFSLMKNFLKTDQGMGQQRWVHLSLSMGKVKILTAFQI